MQQTTEIAQRVSNILKQLADEDIVQVTENEDGSVDLFIITLGLGDGYDVHIQKRQPTF